MENRLDQLFRNRLSKYEEIPSSQAWEHIHEKLASKKKVFWGKRLAIAASVLLIATVGFFGYRSFTNMEVDSGNNLSTSIVEENKLNDQPTTLNDELMPENENSNLLGIEVEGPDKVIAPEPQYEEISEIAEKQDIELELEQVEVPLVAEVKMDVSQEESSGERKLTIEEPERKNEEVFTETQIKEPLIAENSIIEEDKNSNTSENTKKAYPEVKIIYKANTDSELVASGKRSLINKGLNKITEFSDEHLLTADRKEKLRNTKEDLLALNFGKLLNKSNKELEN